MTEHPLTQKVNFEYIPMTHKQWLDNEYYQWVKALQESTVHNFQLDPTVKRMLGCIEGNPFYHLIEQPFDDKLIGTIFGIGTNGNYTPEWSGTYWRMIYYAQQILKRNPSSICEIGGGVGQFYAVLRALGYKGEYGIWDLAEVQSFQDKYLQEVNRVTGLNTLRKEDFSWQPGQPEMIVSFYALGEFDNESRKRYKNLIDETPHGYIAWNPHSGATDDLSIFSKYQITVTPGVEEGIKIVEW